MHVVIYVYEDFTPIEVFGAYNLLSRMPEIDVDLVTEKKGVVYSSDKAISVNIRYSIGDIEHADVLFIPGSIVGWTQQIRNKRVISWIRQLDVTTQYTTAACTGSLILAATGLLKDKKATAFWRVSHLLSDYDTRYVNQPIVEDGKYLTAEGASSTLDLAMRIGKRLSSAHNVKIAQMLLAYESNDLDSLKELKKDEDLLAATNTIIFEEGKSTLSIFDKIINAKLLLRLFKEE